VPIVVEDLHGDVKLATRAVDKSPHWGGAVTTTVFGNCTSGFSAYATGDTSMRHMLTVAHCSGFLDGVAVANGAGERMGSTDFIAETYDAFRPYGYDLGTIRLDPGKSNQPYIYAAGANDFVGHRVLGYGSNGIPAGLTYCVSATQQTPRCNLLSGGEALICPSDGPCARYIAMTSTDRQTIICAGDSGGPVYYWNSSWTGIYAAGLVGAYRDIGLGCGVDGFVSVVATAVSLIPGLAILTG